MRQRLTERLPLHSGKFHSGQTGCIGISVFASMQMLPTSPFLSYFGTSFEGCRHCITLFVLASSFDTLLARAAHALTNLRKLLPFRTTVDKRLIVYAGDHSFGMCNKETRVFMHDACADHLCVKKSRFKLKCRIK